MGDELRCAACRTSLSASTPFCPHCGTPFSTGMFEVGALVDGRYRILSVLGEGAMSAVYLARHERLDREVALKTLRSLLVSDPTAVQRFGREARVVAGLSHPNVVSVFDFSVSGDGVPYLVMERIEGTTLEEELERTRAFTIERASHVLAQIASALAAAHANDLVHRDLKPGNVMLSRRGPDADFVKVVDFGLAQRIGIDPRITQGGSIVGTPFYLAPEAWSGQVDARTDIYAFGVLAYELVTGERPFTASTPTALLMEHMELVPKLPSELAPALAPFDELLMACIAKEPKERPATAAELVDPLRKLLRATPALRRRTTYAALTSPRTPDPTLYDARHGLDAFWDGPALAIEVTTLHAARRRRLRELIDLVWTEGVPPVIAELASQVGDLDTRAEEIGQSAAALDSAIRDREQGAAREEAALRQTLFDAHLVLTNARGEADDTDGPTLRWDKSAFDQEVATSPDGIAATIHKTRGAAERVERLEQELAAFQRLRTETEADDKKNMERLVARLEAVEEQLKAPAEKLWAQIVAATRKRPDLRPALLELGKVDGAIASYRALVSAAVASAD